MMRVQVRLQPIVAYPRLSRRAAIDRRCVLDLPGSNEGSNELPSPVLPRQQSVSSFGVMPGRGLRPTILLWKRPEAPRRIYRTIATMLFGLKGCPRSMR